MAPYPVRWTAQSALHFLPPLTDLFIPTSTRLLREAFQRVSTQSYMCMLLPPPSLICVCYYLHPVLYVYATTSTQSYMCMLLPPPSLICVCYYLHPVLYVYATTSTQSYMCMLLPPPSLICVCYYLHPVLYVYATTSTQSYMCMLLPLCLPLLGCSQAKHQLCT